MMVYTLEALRAEYERGKRYKFLFFWGHTPPADGGIGASCLSQWWMQRFVVDGVAYSCAEQYMMAGKARLFADDEMLSQILAAHTPRQMKAYGRAVRGFDKSLWDACCREIVCEANRAKFRQNPALCEYLLSTRGRILVEASPRDRIWGIGMGGSNPDAGDPRKWRGANLLGFALTKVRDELINEKENAT